MVSLSRAVRAKGKRVDVMFGIEGWRSGVVTRDNVKTFWVLLDGTDDKHKIKDKKGHWRIALPQKKCCKCNDITMQHHSVDEKIRIPTYNGCERELVQDDLYWYCLKCDWDMCDSCMDGKKPPVAEEPYVPDTTGEEEEKAKPAAKTTKPKQKQTQKQKRKQIAAEEHEVPLYDMVESGSKRADDPNTVVRALRWGGVNFGAPLLDYREKSEGGRVIQGSVGWVFTSSVDMGVRKYRRWADGFPKASKGQKKLTFYIAGACFKGATCIKGPLFIYTKYAKIKGSEKQFYVYEAEELMTVARKRVESRTTGWFVAEIRNRFTKYVVTFMEAETLAEKPEPEPEPKPDPEPEPESDPESDPELNEEDPEVQFVDPEVKLAAPKALTIRVKVQNYLGKEITRADRRKLLGYDNLLVQLEAKDLQIAELKKKYKSYVPKAKPPKKTNTVSVFI